TSGASGSWQIIAKDLAPWGGLDQLSGGDTSSPSPVYWRGMAAPLAKAGLDRRMSDKANPMTFSSVDHLLCGPRQNGARSHRQLNTSPTAVAQAAFSCRAATVAI